MSDNISMSKLVEILDKIEFLQIEAISTGYELTIWTDNQNDHHHYRGSTLAEAINRASNHK